MAGFRLLSILLFFAAMTNGGDVLSYADVIKKAERHRMRGEFAEALYNYTAAADVAYRQNDASAEAIALIGIGHVHYIDARYLEATRAFRKAEKISHDANDKQTEALAWAYLGQLYWRIGKADIAEMLLADARRQLADSNDRHGLALTLRFIGRLENGRLRLGESSASNQTAIDLYEQSITICREIRNEECEITATKDLGQAWQTDKHLPEFYIKARSYLATALERTNKTEDLIWLRAVILNNLATNARLQDQLEEASSFADKAIAIFRKVNDRQELREMLDTKARLLFAENRDTGRAESYIRESVAISIDLYKDFYGGSVSRQQYFESIAESFYTQTAFYSRKADPVKTLESIESFRSWELRNLLNAGNAGTANITLSPEERSKERELLADIVRLDKQPDGGKNRVLRRKAEYDEWLAEIEAKYRVRSEEQSFKELSVKEMCSNLPNDRSALLRFDNVKYSAVRLFILTRAKISAADSDIENGNVIKIALNDGSVCNLIVMPLVDRTSSKEVAEAAAFHKRVIEFENQLATLSPAFKVNARYLYQMLLSKADSLLKDVEHYKIINSGNLSRVPFHALIADDGRYVIEHRTISYTPSIGVLQDMSATQQSAETNENAKSFLGLGDVLNDDPRFPQLPDTKTEIQNVARSYQQSKILTDKNATIEQFRNNAARFDTIHIASHGSSDIAQPLSSFLALTPSNSDSGILSAAEISRMRLKARMVVLSACETAYGKEIDGEGVVGLTWAFAAAGVPTIVATAWRVDSKTTSLLMTDLYSQRDPGLRPANALRKAAINRLDDRRTSHPFYWAGFSVTGVW